MSSDTPYAVTLSRVLQDDVAVEPSEAIAILDAIWAVTAPTVDDRGFYPAIPSPSECLLTGFGDVEVERRGRAMHAACGPIETTTSLCRVFAGLTSSGRAGDAGLDSSMVEALQPVRAQATGGSVTFETPDALLAAWTWVRAADGSSALANLYARWEIASVSVPAWAERATMQPVAPPVAVPSTPRLRLPGATRVPTRVGVAAAAAAILIVLVAGTARVRRAPNDHVPAPATRGADASAAAPGDAAGTAANTPAIRPEPEPRDTGVSPTVADSATTPAAAELGTPPALEPAPVPHLDAPAATAIAPRRMVRAADVGATPYSPSFAPATGSLLFHSGVAHTGLHEATLRADGTVAQVRTLVRDGANSYHVQISPDGTQMAFDSDREGERAVYVANRDGSGMRRVSGDGMALVPTWSPDGSRLAFARAEPRRPRVWQLCTVDLRTNRLQQHTSHRVGQPWGGSWFPDGHHLAYSLEDRLVVLDIRSGARRVFASPLPGRLVRTPAVSPDGTRIAFQVRQSGMWMLHVQSGRSVRVLADRSAQEFAWAPDGHSIAYHSVRGGAWEIWTVPVSEL